ncbi:MAG: hypothetical protein DRP42_03200 [Tenericutes bacterium]|nr:MAG: hypothetical protein DRP42_03200 [Mycoplasmatota bacterium]
MKKKLKELSVRVVDTKGEDWLMSLSGLGAVFAKTIANCLFLSPEEVQRIQDKVKRKLENETRSCV